MSGTFAVTTGEEYQTIPYHKANSFRINNFTGKLVGIRPRHKTINVEDFEDQSYTEWTGELKTGYDAMGIDNYGAKIKTLCHRPLTDAVMLDGSEVEVKFDVPDVSDYVFRIVIADSPVRIPIGFAAEYQHGSSIGKHKIIFKLRPSVGKYDAFVEYGGTRYPVSINDNGSFGSANMIGSIIAFEASHDTLVDSIVYQQKVNYSNEILHGSSSVNYPCVDNVSEYEVINLGSDVLNYSDNTDNITLSGFYES